MDASAAALLRVRGLSCSYGAVRALTDIDVDVQEGEVVCVLGVNGAGKTTLLSAIAGAVRAAAGRIEVGGVDVTGSPPEAMVGHGVALVPEGRQVFPSMSVRDNLLLGGFQHRRRPAVLTEGLDEVHELFPVLAQRAGVAAGRLSGGEQQMLAIGRALMGRPRLLMLDEPSLGLAPRIVRLVMEMIGRLPGTGRGVLLVEQLARFALEVSGRGYLLDSGVGVLSGTAGELQADSRVREIYMGGGS